MVARVPFLYADVPSTMSFSVCPMTFRHQRSTAFAEMPVGSDFASGRCVARMRKMPSAGPRFTRSVQIASSSAPYLGCSNHFWHSSTNAPIGCSPSDLRSASSGVTLFSGQMSRGRSRMTRARRRSSSSSSRMAASA